MLSAESSTLRSHPTSSISLTAALTETDWSREVVEEKCHISLQGGRLRALANRVSAATQSIIKVPVADDATSVHWSPVVSDELWSFEDSSVVQQGSVNEMILRQAGQINRDAISANERLFIAL